MTTSQFMRVTFLMLVALLITGCEGTQRLTLKHSALSVPTRNAKRRVSLKFTDKRQDKRTIGIFTGVFWKKYDIVPSDDLATSFAQMFTDVLGQAGYSVVPEANARLYGEVLDFRVEGDGWTVYAKEGGRATLRNPKGEILWEKTLIGEYGGWNKGSYEDIMNKALAALLNNALEDFRSEFFEQTVKRTDDR